MNWILFFPLAGFFAIVVLIAARVLFLKKRNVRVSSAAEKTSTKKGLLYILFLLILIVWLYELAKPIFGFSVILLPETLSQPLFSSSIIDIIGALLISAALMFLFLALLHFKQSLRFGLDENNQGKLITTGIFSFSRNPFFLSLDLYFLGLALIFSNLFFVSFAVLAILSIHFFILKEEKFLRKVYGDEYEKYAKKVRRYF